MPARVTDIPYGYTGSISKGDFCLSIHSFTLHTHIHLCEVRASNTLFQQHSDEQRCALVRYIYRILIMAFLYPQVLERQRKANLPTAMRIGVS